MNPTEARDRISSMGPKDWKLAVTSVEAIDDPWFKCQALAYASLLIPDTIEQRRVIESAFDAAERCLEPNRVGTVSSWPLKALYKLEHSELANRKTLSILEVVLQDQSPVRRADALNFLLGAALRSRDEVFLWVYEAFFVACTTPLASGRKNSKGQSLLAEWAGIVGRRHKLRGDALLAAIEGPYHSRRATEIADLRTHPEAISWPNI